MNIQPTTVSNSHCVNFEGKRKSTDLPKELKAKPRFTLSKFSLASLACVALMVIGSFLYRQSDQYLIERNKYLFREWLKEATKLSEIKTDSTYATPQDTVVIQERMEKLMQEVLENSNKINKTKDKTNDTVPNMSDSTSIHRVEELLQELKQINDSIKTKTPKNNTTDTISFYGANLDIEG